MILQALAAYYGRLLREGAGQPPGFQEKEILWVIELDAFGRFVALRRTGDDKGRARKFVVPAEVQRSVNIAANLLWDNAEYALGLPRPSSAEKQAAKVPERHAAFLRRLHELPAEASSDAGVTAVQALLERRDFAELQAADGWAELTQGGANVAFKLAGDEDLVCQRPVVRAAVVAENARSAGVESELWCLVTGQRAIPARLHPDIRGVRGRGAQPRGAKLVSFDDPAFRSHNWSQGENAPISAAAAHAYATALNHLLARDNDRHHLTEGDTTFVFWAATETPIEDRFAHLLGSYAAKEREPDGTLMIESFDSVRKGLRPCLEDATPFYILGLAPNSARLAVRFWHAGTVAETAQNLLAHFDDLEVIALERGPPPGLWRLLGATAVGGDAGKLQDQLRGVLAAELIAAILNHQPYPATLLARTLARCRAEQSVWPVRAGLIKATLNRRSTGKELTVSLDPSDPNPGYRLGRLFAILENVQQRAQGDINTTIRDRYFAAAIATPRSVMAELMQLKNAHLKKLRRRTPRLAAYFEKQIDQILDALPAASGLPPSLSLDDQGRFILGYHHQRNYRGAQTNEALADLPEPAIAR